MVPQRFWDHDLDLLRSRDVVDHMTAECAMYGFLFPIGGPLKLLLCDVYQRNIY